MVRDHVETECQSATKRDQETEGVKSMSYLIFHDLCGEESTNRTIELRDTGENDRTAK